MLALDVKDLAPGKTVTLGGAASIRFPRDLATLEEGTWKAQVVFDRDLGGRAIGSGAGNLKSDTVTFEVVAGAPVRAGLTATSVITARPFKETARVKELVVPSARLSAHYGRPTSVKAAVALPADYDPNGQRRWPVIFEIPGFGGRHRWWSGNEKPTGTLRDGESFVHVLLDPECPGGHHVFADSANNGPWGTALVADFIPALESAYRVATSSEGRFLHGTFERRLVEPLPSGHPPESVRRHVVDVARPRRLSRLSAHRPDTRRNPTCSRIPKATSALSPDRGPV
jgi:hypothetical protein